MKTAFAVLFSVLVGLPLGPGIASAAPPNSAVAAKAVPQKVSSITQYGITWTFDKEYPSGQFCTGDYWVVGPVTVIGITNSCHNSGFTPEAGDDGSMLNPGTTDRQGYDKDFTGNYSSSLIRNLKQSLAVGQLFGLATLSLHGC